MNKKKPYLLIPQVLATMLVVAAFFLATPLAWTQSPQVDEGSGAGAPADTGGGGSGVDGSGVGATSVDDPKVYLYAGVITIQPTTSAGTADRVFEIGNYNSTTDSTDFVSSSTAVPVTNIYLRPNQNVVSVGARDTTTGGGKIILAKPVASLTGEFALEHFVETGVSYVGFTFNGVKQFWIGTGGDTHIKPGSSLCFAGDCKSAWSQIGGGADGLNDVIDQARNNNTSIESIVLGQGGGAGIRPSTAWVDTTVTTGNAISVKSDQPFDSAGNVAAVYANDRNSYSGPTVGFGYSGYFSGRVGFFQAGFNAASVSFPAATLVRVAGNLPKTTNFGIQSRRAILDIRNEYSNNAHDPLAVNLVGAVDIFGNGAATETLTQTAGALAVSNTDGNGLRVTGADVGSGGVSAAVSVTASPTVAGKVTYGIKASGGWLTFQGASLSTPAVAEGYLSIVAGSQSTWGLHIGPAGGAKSNADLQVCLVGSDTCYGRYLYTSGTGARNVDRGATRFFYHDPATGTIASKLVFGSEVTTCDVGPVLTPSATGRTCWTDASCGAGASSSLPFWSDQPVIGTVYCMGNPYTDITGVIAPPLPQPPTLTTESTTPQPFATNGPQCHGPQYSNAVHSPANAEFRFESYRDSAGCHYAPTDGTALGYFQITGYQFEGALADDTTAATHPRVLIPTYELR